MGTKRERIRKNTGHSSAPYSVGYPPLFAAHGESIARDLCIVAAQEPVTTAQWSRTAGLALTNYSQNLRALERRGFIARYYMQGRQNANKYYPTQWFLDRESPIFDELLGLTRVLCRSTGLPRPKGNDQWRGLQRISPPPANDVTALFGPNPRTLAIVLVHLRPGVPEGFVIDMCSVNQGNARDLFEPLVRDGVIGRRYFDRTVLYGPNEAAPWNKAVLALIQKAADLHPNFEGLAMAVSDRIADSRMANYFVRAKAAVFPDP